MLKKITLLMFLIFLVGCRKDPTEGIIDNIATTMLNGKANYTIEEEFEWTQYAADADNPINIFANYENTLEYDSGSGITYTNTNATIETDFKGQIIRENSQFESYIDIYDNAGYLKIKGDDWYKADLSIYPLDYNSINPETIIDALVYKNEGLYYRSSDGVLGDEESYEYAIITISGEIFENIFNYKIWNDIHNGYSYEVTATIKFDQNYQIEYIEFDLKDMIAKVKNYMTYEEHIQVRSISGNLKLTFPYAKNSTEYLKNNMLSDLEKLSYKTFEVDDVYYVLDNLSSSSDLQKVTATSVYYSNKYINYVSVDFAKDVAYLYYQLYFLKDGKVVGDYKFSQVDISKNTKIDLFLEEDITVYDEIYSHFKYVGVSQTVDDSRGAVNISNDSIVEVNQKVSYNILGPKVQLSFEAPIQVDIQKNVYADIYIKNLNTEVPRALGLKEIAINVATDMDVRNLKVSVYVLKDDILEKVFYAEEKHLNKFDYITIKEYADFFPEEFYAKLEYNTTSNQHVTKIVRPSVYHDNVDFPTFSYSNIFNNYIVFDEKWQLNNYNLYFNLSNSFYHGYLYLVNEDEIVDVKYVAGEKLFSGSYYYEKLTYAYIHVNSIYNTTYKHKNRLVEGVT